MASRCGDDSAFSEHKSSKNLCTCRNGFVTRTPVICPEMCCYCFDILIGYMRSNTSANSSMKNYFANEEYPLFVTWKYGRDLKLRGCMGTFTAKKIHTGLAEYTITSSMKDSRFKPIQLEEVRYLQCGVSLLVNFEVALDYLDWEIGLHGIQIEFIIGGISKTATYLPEVAAEQGWTKTQAIDSLLLKGGYKDKVTEHLRRTLRVTRYQSEKYSLTYDEYVQYCPKYTHR